jgi:hypothetical protein
MGSGSNVEVGSCIWEGSECLQVGQVEALPSHLHTKHSSSLAPG